MEFKYKSGARPLDGFTIKRGLGWGGFGEVYYAISDGGKEVALKLIQRHLEVELRGVAQCMNLKSPNLISTFDVRTDSEGQNWIVMEYVAGQSLQQRLERLGGPMELSEALHWLDGIATAVDYLHQHGIVHRDLKPGNIFGENETVKVGDYGLSKFITASRRSGQTQSVGTVHYMAPEISNGNYGRGVDVYSTAIMAFEMLTGEVPFDGETAGEVLMKHLTAEPSLEKLEGKFRPIFSKALAKEPSERFESVGNFFEALRTAGTPEAKPAEEPPPKSAEPVPKVSLPPTPGTFRAKRRAVSEMLWSMFLAGLLSLVLPILVMATEMILSDKIPDLVHYVSLAMISGIASWGLLGLGRLWDLTQLESSSRRLHVFLFGLGIGTIVMLMDLWTDRQGFGSALESIDLFSLDEQSLRFPLDEQSLRLMVKPFLIYLTLFGLAFVIPDWAKSVSKNRRGRFSLWRAIWPGSVGIVLAGFLGGQVPLDAIWVGGVLATTAIIIQWVSPYEPRKRLRHLAAR